MTAASHTPAASWRAAGEPDPHGKRYDCERAALCMGGLSDDELANGVFLHGNAPLDIAKALAGAPGYHPAIAWLTAAKDRIRWLSRSLEREKATSAALLAASEGGKAYRDALAQCGNDPQRMASFCTAEGDDLDALFATWEQLSDAAIAKATGSAA